MFNIKFALRTLFKTPFVTIFAIISIALGIGANTAMFSIFEQVLRHPLPVQEPDRLVNLAEPEPAPQGWTRSGDLTIAGSFDEAFSYPMFRDLEKIQTVFTGIAAHHSFSANLAARGEAQNGAGLLVSGGYFPVLGVKPALGRLLTAQDDRVIGGLPVAVLSYAYWETRFGRDPGVLNQTIVVNGQMLTIVGVAQRGFEGTSVGLRPQVFVPITMRDLLVREQWQTGYDEFNSRRHYWTYLFARLKPGITIEQAHAILNSQFHAIVSEVELPLSQAVNEQAKSRFKEKQLVLSNGARGQSNFGKGTETSLKILLGLAGFVLVIACANVANLLLARGAARAGEIAVRLSIGASRLRVVMQLLTESCLLAVFAGIVSIWVAQLTLDLFSSLLPAGSASIIQFTLSRPALIFAAILTIGTGLLFGFFPALHTAGLDLVSAIKTRAGQSSGAKSAARFRTVLVTAQIALSLALLVIAGLFAKSLFNVGRVNLGMKIDHIVTFSISPFRNGYTHKGSMQLFERMENDLAALPGVISVSSATLPPFTGGWREAGNVSVEGFKPAAGTYVNSRYEKIGPAYFRTLGIPLLSGREFTPSDSEGRPKVAVVNEAFVRKFNLGRDAIGKHIGDNIEGLSPDTEIVGIVQNAKFSDVYTTTPMFFRAYRQGIPAETLTFYVQTSLNPDQLFKSIRTLMAQRDATLPAENLRSLPEQLHASTFAERVMSILSAAFACLALLLAAVGLYGVLAYIVALRTQEIGLRMALGASRAQVGSMVLRKVGLMALVGCAIGLIFAIAFGRMAAFMLYQLQGFDPVVFCSAIMAMALVALAAGFIPAYRAARIDPMTALRYE
jgi:predicted permease